MILIYHAKDPTFGITRKTWPDDYELVAFVDTDNPEEAFYLTQHIEREWWKNDKVNLVKQSRSTSVGDVLADQNSGELLLVEGTGFSVIGRINPKRNPYTPRYIERSYKAGLKLFNEIKNFRPESPEFVCHDIIIKKLSYHFAEKVKSPISISEFLIWKAIDELESYRAKLTRTIFQGRPYLEVTIAIKAYLNFLRISYSRYREHKWTEWD